MCLPLITGLRGVRLVKALKTVQLHLPPRIGAWCWQRRANRRRRTKHLKNFAARTGGPFTVLLGDKAPGQKRRKTSRKVSSRCCSNAEIWKPSAARRDVYVPFSLPRSRISWLRNGVTLRSLSAVKVGRLYHWTNCSRASALILSQRTP